MRFLASTVCLSALLGSTGLSHAQTALSLDETIDRVEDAYSTDRLLRARTIRMEEDRREAFRSHDYGPDFHEMTAQRRHYVFDLQGERATSEYVTLIGTNTYHGRSIVADGEALFIDYGANSYEPQGAADFTARHNDQTRASDVLLAMKLASNPETARLARQAMWLGSRHSVVELPMDGSVPMMVYVENDTGFIRKMTRTVSPDITVFYTYDHHTVEDGVAVAREFSVYANRDPLFFSFARGVRVNDRRDRKAFKVDRGVVEEPSRVDQSEMTVDDWNGTAFHVGMGESYTTFFPTTEGLVAVGTHAGLSDRLKAYREDTGDRQPLRYAVVADHQAEELAGIEDALAETATLVVTPHTLSRLTDIRGAEDGIIDILTVADRQTVAGLELMMIPTSDASQVLVTYDPDARLVLQSGHYVSPYEATGFYAKHSAVSLMDGLEPMGLSPSHIVSSQSRKAEAWTDFVQAVETYDPTRCFKDRPICDGL
ncbi:MAG: hypothetical protein WBF53_03735 [Litorimonas sp.]